MKWLRRTDNARRTKGDPPPTYAQLEAKVARLEEQKALLVEECNNLDTRNIHLRDENRALRESNLRLTNDADQLRKRLPRIERLAAEGICGSKAAPSPFSPDDPTEVCVLPYGHASDWHEAEGGMRWTYQLTTSAPDLPVPHAMVTTDDFSTNLAAMNPDPDPTRPYIPTYEEEQR